MQTCYGGNLDDAHSGIPFAYCSELLGFNTLMTSSTSDEDSPNLDQGEVDWIFQRLGQIAPHIPNLYSRPTSLREMEILRGALDFWENGDSSLVNQMKKRLKQDN